tara:strand:- start:141865 stop:142452 length:588 start_codon:yes stop_codon:yes gene_type:complete
MQPEDIERLTESLMHKRILGIMGRIDGKKMSDVISRMLFLQSTSNDRIDLLINSSGGNIGAALELCDVITHILAAPVRGIAIGSCKSAATFIMMHCDERFCTPHAKFVIHSGTWNDLSLPMNGDSREHLQNILDDVEAETEMVIKLYMKKLGKTRAEVKQIIGRGDQKFNNRLSAKEAKDIGMIETITSEKLDLF